MQRGQNREKRGEEENKFFYPALIFLWDVRGGAAFGGSIAKFVSLIEKMGLELKRGKK